MRFSANVDSLLIFRVTGGRADAMGTDPGRQIR